MKTYTIQLTKIIVESVEAETYDQACETLNKYHDRDALEKEWRDAEPTMRMLDFEQTS